MELVRFKARCRECHKRLRITLCQARADQSVACPKGHQIQARAAIERELIGGVNQGSRHYFECLVYIFDREVRGIISRSLQPWLHSDLAGLETDDAVQELYLDLWQKKLGTIEKTLTAYIRTMAYYKGIDRMRERQDGLIEPLVDNLRSAASGLAAEELVLTLERGQQLELLERALSKLPREQREVHRLRRVEGWSTPEVANFLSIPPGTVKSRLSRAEEEIRRILMTAAPVRSVQ